MEGALALWGARERAAYGSRAVGTAVSLRQGFRLRRWCRFNAADFGETSRSVRAKANRLASELL